MYSCTSYFLGEGVTVGEELVQVPGVGVLGVQLLHAGGRAHGPLRYLQYNVDNLILDMLNKSCLIELETNFI